MDGTGMGDTRARIRRIAMKLFTEHGYEKTSLRQIAEHLGVTKAALYYHFKSKEEIVESFVADQIADIDELISWLRTQPATLTARQEFLRRYSAIITGERHQCLTRFLMNNQATSQHMAAGLKMRDRFIELLRMMVGSDAPLADQLRTALAIWAVNGGWFILRNSDASAEEIQAAALEVSLELISQAAGSAPNERPAAAVEQRAAGSAGPVGQRAAGSASPVG